MRKDLFLQLAQSEARHAQLWRDKLTAAGRHDERFVVGFRTRLLSKLVKRFGPDFVLSAVAATEFSDRNKYAGQTDAHAISAEERGHAAVIQAATATSDTSGTTGPDIARADPGTAVHREITYGRRFLAQTMVWYRTSAWSWP